MEMIEKKVKQDKSFLKKISSNLGSLKIDGILLNDCLKPNRTEFDCRRSRTSAINRSLAGTFVEPLSDLTMMISILCKALVTLKSFALQEHSNVQLQDCLKKFVFS